MPNLGEEVWQTKIRLLHAIQLLRHPVGNHHAIISLGWVDHAGDQVVACTQQRNAAASTGGIDSTRVLCLAAVSNC